MADIFKDIFTGAGNALNAVGKTYESMRQRNPYVIQREAARQGIENSKAQAQARLESEKARKAYWESKIGQGMTPPQAIKAYTDLIKARDSVSPEDTKQLEMIDSLASFLAEKAGYKPQSEPGELEQLGNAWLNPGGILRTTPEKPKEQTAGLFSGLGSKVAGAARGLGGALGRMNTAQFPATGFPQRPAKPAGSALGAIDYTPPGVQSKWNSMMPEERTAYYTGKPKPPDMAAQAMEGGAPGPDGSTGIEQAPQGLEAIWAELNEEERQTAQKALSMGRTADDIVTYFQTQAGK